MLELELPTTRAATGKLRVGQLVLVTGTVYTARDLVHKRVGETGLSGLPRGFKNGAIYHCGPIVRRRGGDWQVVAAGPTTSARMDQALPAFLRAVAPSAIIGKGGISREAVKLLVEHGCPYLSMTGGTAALAASMVKRARGPFWRDLGDAEAVWELDVERFGPLVVTVDSTGECLFDKIAELAAKRATILSGESA